MSITDSSRASTPYSGTLNHPAPHVPAQALMVVSAVYAEKQLNPVSNLLK